MTTSHFNRTQILLEPAQRRKLSQIARLEKRSLSDVVRGMIDAQLVSRKRQEMAAAAQALLSDYKLDKELTVFTVLDGEEIK
jgi:hypothetical protein